MAARKERVMYNWETYNVPNKQETQLAVVQAQYNSDARDGRAIQVLTSMRSMATKKDIFPTLGKRCHGADSSVNDSH